MDPMQPDPATTPAKSATPIYVLAGMSYIPLFGIILGAAGLTWGLLSSRPRAIRAGLIAGGGFLLNIVGIGVLTAFLATDEGSIYDQARELAAQQDLLTLVREIEEYRDANDEYPASLTALQKRPAMLRTINIYDRTAGVLTPRVYVYERARDGSSYDLYSRGVDGEAGTPDDIRPALPDSVAARAGYQPTVPVPDP
jgi:hypothetical protein